MAGKWQEEGDPGAIVCSRSYPPFASLPTPFLSLTCTGQRIGMGPKRPMAERKSSGNNSPFHSKDHCSQSNRMYSSQFMGVWDVLSEGTYIPHTNTSRHFPVLASVSSFSPAAWAVQEQHYRFPCGGHLLELKANYLRLLTGKGLPSPANYLVIIAI